MPHIVLLGNSIFDNKPYLEPGESVINDRAACFPMDWQSTPMAYDGTVTKELSAQFARLPASATYVVISYDENGS